MNTYVKLILSSLLIFGSHGISASPLNWLENNPGTNFLRNNSATIGLFATTFNAIDYCSTGLTRPTVKYETPCELTPASFIAPIIVGITATMYANKNIKKDSHNTRIAAGSILALASAHLAYCAPNQPEGYIGCLFAGYYAYANFRNFFLKTYTQSHHRYLWNLSRLAAWRSDVQSRD